MDKLEVTPKVIRASGGAEAAPQVLRAGASDGSQTSELEKNAAELRHTTLRAGDETEEKAEASVRIAASAAETTAEQILTEVVTYVGRTAGRNAQAIRAVLGCRTLFDVVRWQGELAYGTISDGMSTNARIFNLVAYQTTNTKERIAAV